LRSRIGVWRRATGRLGQTAREIEELTKAVELSGNSAYMRAHLAYGLAMAGNVARARAIQQELELEGRERYASPYHFALIAAGLNDRAGVASWIRGRSRIVRDGWCFCR
jgi:hypothetical protein